MHPTDFSCRTLLVSLTLCCLFSRALPAAPFASFQEDAPGPLPGLVGADISDLSWSGKYLWATTDEGVARLDPRQSDGLGEADWVTFTAENGIGRGFLSALDSVGDTVWVASLVDTSIGNSKQAGTGLTFSVNAGTTWTHISNEVIFDLTKPGFAPGPSTPVDNPCFGLAIDGETIWAAFFSGGSVRSRDGGRTWERVLPDGAAPEDIIFNITPSVTFLPHRTFSVEAYNDTVWIGTAGGIGSSFDGGATWQFNSAQLDANNFPLPNRIAANWVLGIRRQLRADGSSAVWAGARSTAAADFSQTSAISWTLDAGQTWQSSGPTFAWDFGFSTNKIWAATSDGLLASPDQGQTWEEVVVEDPFLRDQLRGVFAGAVALGDTIWVGAENGLGRSTDEGKSWRIITFPVQPLSADSGEFVGGSSLVDSVRTYAAPTPFSPNQDETTRVVYSLSANHDVTIEIYDFASRRIRTLLEAAPRSAGQIHGENWDGLDSDGDPVANGVYFYRIELSSGREVFGKIVVLD